MRMSLAGSINRDNLTAPLKTTLAVGYAGVPR